MISGKKVRGAAAMAGLAISAASASPHASAANLSVKAQERSGTTGSKQPTAAVVARYAGYLTTLQTPSDITREGVEHGTSVQLASIDSGAHYRSPELRSGWRYFVEYFSGSKTV